MAQLFRKAAIPFGMIISILAVLIFGRTEALLMIPGTTPEAFLAGMPYSMISLLGKEVVLIQPSSTFLVYFLGILILAVGSYFVATRKFEKSRATWGLGSILWGLGALVAGTSYQAFGYELKCRGRPLCLFTSDFELVYLLLTAYSINFLVAATGYSSARSRLRKGMVIFSVVDSAAYTVMLILGAIIPVRFLVSYEGFMAFIGVNFLLMFGLNVLHYRKERDRLNRNMIVVWIGFLLVNLGYFAALFSGYAPILYENYGLWFNENDVLHFLLVIWAVMGFLLLRKPLADVKE